MIIFRELPSLAKNGSASCLFLMILFFSARLSGNWTETANNKVNIDEKLIIIFGQRRWDTNFFFHKSKCPYYHQYLKLFYIETEFKSPKGSLYMFLVTWSGTWGLSKYFFFLRIGCAKNTKISRILMEVFWRAKNFVKIQRCLRLKDHLEIC